MFSRNQLKRAATLTEEDFLQLGKCRRPHNRLGFAYQVAFVRLLGRFPQQRPFELIEERCASARLRQRLNTTSMFSIESLSARAVTQKRAFLSV
jgi:hypothetical protein